MSLLRSLRAVKVVHTVIWTFFVVCILAIPAFTLADRLGAAAIFAAVVAIECGVLVFNQMRCPLTDVAERFTDDRRANFDIYLPEWLARHNKTIFGTLYTVAVLFLIARWLQAP